MSSSPAPRAAGSAAGPPIVAIGASAGGLDPLRTLFAALPADSGLAFVVIQHLDPTAPSQLTELLARVTSMPVAEITDGLAAEPDRVYVIPPSADLGLEHGLLRLVPRGARGARHLPIDAFFRALARDHGSRAIGVVLSGSGADGTVGLTSIKEAGGITFAQLPASAEFASMPQSAIAAGVVDFSLEPEAIARELGRLGRHAYLVAAAAPDAADDDTGGSEAAPPGLAEVIAHVRDTTGIEFANYKKPTVARRVARRMALHHLDRVEDYAALLDQHPDEIHALAEDMLVHVTSFFRDPEAFRALQTHALTPLVERAHDGASLRLWVAGCSTGQEVYSVAIALLELIDRQPRRIAVRIFGSDLGERAIERARSGLYSMAELEGVSPRRLTTWFDRADEGFRICKRVRELCIFVRHDLTRDPPFANLDLISCRNVLIYFDAELQARILPMLHHCLRTPGYLFLGRQESVSASSGLFLALDKHHRVFLRTGGSSPRRAFSAPLPPLALGREPEAYLERRVPTREAARQADHFLLARYAPPAVVVDERFEIIEFRGRTGRFLDPPPGAPQLNLLRMVGYELAAQLHDALNSALRDGVAARREVQDSRAGVVALEVVPLIKGAQTEQRYFLVIFDEGRQRLEQTAPPAPSAPADRTDEASRLAAELRATRDYVEALVLEHQRAADDHLATNEGLIAANEELQSTNEELESAKEELQSTNEELESVNDELNARNEQLDRLASDLVNVLESVDIPIIMVDGALAIRRFTPSAQLISNLIPADIGRSIEDLKLKLEVDDLGDRIRQVVRSLAPREWQVQDTGGRWFRLQIRPYRTTDNRLDGAVLALVEIDALTRAAHDARVAYDYAQRIVEAVPSALVILGSDLRVVSANRAFYRLLGDSSAPVVGLPIFELAGGCLHQPALTDAIEHCLERAREFSGLELDCKLPRGGAHTLSITARQLVRQGDDTLLLLAIEDVTERRDFEARRAELLSAEMASRVEAERANQAKDFFLATLSHELRTPLTVILMSAHVLRDPQLDRAIVQNALGAIERAAANQGRLVDDLLDISRIVAGKLVLDSQVVDLATVARAVHEASGGAARARNVTLEAEIADGECLLVGDTVRLQQIITNLVDNAIKFTPAGGRVRIAVECLETQLRLRVSDSGIGIPPERQAEIFDRFMQVDNSMTRNRGGLGLGLAIVRHLVEAHRGQIRVESPGAGQGTTFEVLLPRAEPGLHPPEDALAPQVRDLAGVRVLVVDDDDDTRLAILAMLEQLGIEVATASSATEGLALVESFDADVIVCDIAMPGEDGHHFVRTLRSRGPMHGGLTPAIALTALAGEEDRKRAIDAGFHMHLAKPITQPRLAAAIGMLSRPRRPVPAPVA